MTTDRIITCDVDPSCTCQITEAASTEVTVHVHDGHAVCAHHAEVPHDPTVAPFPCQRTGGAS